MTTVFDSYKASSISRPWDGGRVDEVVSELEPKRSQLEHTFLYALTDLNTPRADITGLYSHKVELKGAHDLHSRVVVTFLPIPKPGTVVDFERNSFCDLKEILNVRNICNIRDAHIRAINEDIVNPSFYFSRNEFGADTIRITDRDVTISTHFSIRKKESPRLATFEDSQLETFARELANCEKLLNERKKFLRMVPQSVLSITMPQHFTFDEYGFTMAMITKLKRDPNTGVASQQIIFTSVFTDELVSYKLMSYTAILDTGNYFRWDMDELNRPHDHRFNGLGDQFDTWTCMTHDFKPYLIPDSQNALNVHCFPAVSEINESAYQSIISIGNFIALSLGRSWESILNEFINRLYCVSESQKVLCYDNGADLFRVGAIKDEYGRIIRANHEMVSVSLALMLMSKYYICKWSYVAFNKENVADLTYCGTRIPQKLRRGLLTPLMPARTEFESSRSIVVYPILLTTQLYLIRDVLSRLNIGDVAKRVMHNNKYSSMKCRSTIVSQVHFYGQRSDPKRERVYYFDNVESSVIPFTVDDVVDMMNDIPEFSESNSIRPYVIKMGSLSFVRYFDRILRGFQIILVSDIKSSSINNKSYERNNFMCDEVTQNQIYNLIPYRVIRCVHKNGDGGLSDL